MAGDNRTAGGLTRSLGWFSIGLGAAQLASPGALNRFAGVRPTDGSDEVVRAVGVRELLVGAGLLVRSRPTGFLRARVVGDLVDLALLANARTTESDTERTRLAMRLVAGVLVVDLLAVVLERRRARGTGAIEARTAITVNATPDELYAVWRRFEELPTFMDHLESVSTDGNGRTHWVARGPAGTSIEWDAEITDDVPGERITWKSVKRAKVANEGSVRFRPAPGDRGTEVRVEIRYAPPGGRLGATVAKIFGEEPDQQISDDLRRFKQIVETGEIARSDGSPRGTRTKNALHQRDAQPLDLTRREVDA